MARSPEWINMDRGGKKKLSPGRGREERKEGGGGGKGRGGERGKGWG